MMPKDQGESIPSVNSDAPRVAGYLCPLGVKGEPLPGDHLKLLHLWPGQTPPPGTAGRIGLYHRIVARWPIPATVRCAVDAIVALKEVERATPDLMVCDVSPTRRANLGFVRHLARLPAAADTAIVLVSAFEAGTLERLGGVPPA